MHLVHTLSLYRSRMNLDPSWGSEPSLFSALIPNGVVRTEGGRTLLYAPVTLFPIEPFAPARFARGIRQRAQA